MLAKAKGQEALYFVDQGEVVAERQNGEVARRYGPGQWFGEVSLISGPSHVHGPETYRASGSLSSKGGGGSWGGAGAVDAPLAIGAVLFKVTAEQIRLLGPSTLHMLASIGQSVFIKPVPSSVCSKYPLGQYMAARRMRGVVRRLPSYSRSIADLSEGEVFAVLEEHTDKTGQYHIRMSRVAGSASGPEIKSGWVTAAPRAELQEDKDECKVDVDIVKEVMNTLVLGSAHDKLRLYFALYLSEDKSVTALGSTRCVDALQLPRFFDTVCCHFGVDASMLEELQREATLLMAGKLSGAEDSSSLTSASRTATTRTATATVTSTEAETLGWDWLWAGCRRTKGLRERVEQPRLCLRHPGAEKGSTRITKGALQAQSEVSEMSQVLSPRMIMATGNLLGPDASTKARQKRAQQRRDNREAFALSTTTGTAESQEEAGEQHVETIGPPAGLDRHGRLSLASFPAPPRAASVPLEVRNPPLSVDRLSRHSRQCSGNVWCSQLQLLPEELERSRVERSMREAVREFHLGQQMLAMG